MSKKSSRGDQIENAQYFDRLNVSSFIEEDAYSWQKIKEMIDTTISNKVATLGKINDLDFSNATQKVLDVLKLIAK